MGAPTGWQAGGALLYQLQANAEQAHKAFDFGFLHVDHFS